MKINPKAIQEIRRETQEGMYTFKNVLRGKSGQPLIEIQETSHGIRTVTLDSNNKK